MKKLNNKIQAKKRFGQNFLQNQEVIDAIINSVEFSGKEIIEIGPGHGAITIELAKQAKDLIAYEIDKSLIPKLENVFKNKANVKIINQDFLEVDLNFSSKKTIIANIPYNITSDILFKVFGKINNFETIALMVQDEVADRIVAKPNTSDFSKLSLACQYVAEVEKMFRIHPNSFFPEPKVFSAFVIFKVKKNINQEQANIFFNFVKKCFSMKRKTFFNNLITFLNKENVNLIFEHFGLNPNVRPQQLNLEQYIQICNFVISNKLD